MELRRIDPNEIIYIYIFFPVSPWTKGKKILLRLNVFRHKGREIVGKFACYTSGLGVSLILIAHDDNIHECFSFFLSVEKVMRRNALETQYSTTVQAVYTSYNTRILENFTISVLVLLLRIIFWLFFSSFKWFLQQNWIKTTWDYVLAQ